MQKGSRMALRLLLWMLRAPAERAGLSADSRATFVATASEKRAMTKSAGPSTMIGLDS